MRRLVDDLVLVDEGDIDGRADAAGDREDACGRRGVVLTAMLRHPERFLGQEGGAGAVWRQYRPAAAGRDHRAGHGAIGRLARIRVSARDVPGALARITAALAEVGANIEEVHHQRAFTMLAAQNVEIELVLQTRGRTHVEEVLEHRAP